jgi:hypothetical protein
MSTEALDPDIEVESSEDSNGHLPEENPSLLDELRRQRDEIGEDQRVDLDIPGYNGKLVARYRRVEYEELATIAKRVNKSKHPQKELRAQCETIATACVEILIRQEGELKQLGPTAGVGDGPVKYDARLGQVLGFDPQGSGVAAVLAAFNNEVAIPSHHNELAEWFAEGDADLAADFPISS